MKCHIALRGGVEMRFGDVMAVIVIIVAIMWLAWHAMVLDTRVRTRIAREEWKRLEAADSASVRR